MSGLDRIERLTTWLESGESGDSYAVFRAAPEASQVLKEQAATIRSLRGALGELHAMVWGECSSLLNEDSGGDADLDLLIRSLIQGHSNG